MRTFKTTLRSRSFGLAVIIPPLGFWLIVQGFALRAGDGPMNVWALATLVLLAQALPLAALGWTLCSVAAYTVAPGQLIEHRVVRDRRIALGSMLEPPQLAEGVVIVRLSRRTLRLRVVEAEACRAMLRAAGPADSAQVPG